MKKITLMSLCVFVTLTAGCKIAPKMSSQRLATYKSLAFKCVPGPGEKPEYKQMIDRKINRRAARYLPFLNKAKVVDEITVDAGSIPTISSDTVPMVNLTDASNFDAAAILIYYIKGITVCLDIHIFDTKTGKRIWYYRIKKLDLNTKQRLNSHAHWTPSVIKASFYGR